MKFPEVNLSKGFQQKNFRVSLTIYLLLGVIFFMPYLILLKYFKFAIDINWSHFYQSILVSCTQAGLVVSLCAVISLVHFRALFFFGRRSRAFIKNLLIVPVLLPAIFTILIAFSIINPFPFGFTGVVVIFFMTYFGYFFVSLSEAIESKLGEQFLVKEVYGLSNYSFLVSILWPHIRKEVLSLSLIVFVGCFSSLSIPLVASGGRSVNFELFIFETIFIQNDWNSAIILSLVQALMLLVLGLWIKKYSIKSVFDRCNEFNLRSGVSLGFIALYLIVYFGSLLFFTGTALSTVRWETLDSSLMLEALANSIFLFLLLAIVFTLFLVGLGYLFFHRRSVEFYKFFLTPSSVIVGFAFYLFFHTGSIITEYIKMTLGLFVVYSCSLFFNFISSPLEQLNRQVLTAKIYNLGFKDTLTEIIWPQLYDKYFLCLSILLLVSLTDFAVIKAVGAQTTTMGTFMYSYLSSYRLQWAFVFSFFTLIIWIIFLYALKRSFYVLNKKSKI